MQSPKGCSAKRGDFVGVLCAVTLKNAAELLEFSTVYNADQLKLSCLQFMALNMAALLESRWDREIKPCCIHLVHLTPVSLTACNSFLRSLVRPDLAELALVFCWPWNNVLIQKCSPDHVSTPKPNLTRE